jgi:hypothetical protein
VDVHVDESGRRDTPPRRREADRDDAPVVDLHVAANERTVDECVLDAELHAAAKV